MMSRESITEQHKHEAKRLAQKIQKSLQNKVRVQIDHNTWLYLPKKLVRSKRKLKAYLTAREARIQGRKKEERQLVADRVARTNAATKAKRRTKDGKKH